ncbi:MAG: helix-turn-helix domain-containing protein [Clostridia bacterium]|nr:helix-turn-helix domain-containing protein [Clostridia bacterium]
MKNISLIGIDGKLEYPLHTHESYEIIHYFEGIGRMKLSSGELPFAPGSIILTPAGVPHGTASEHGFKAFVMKEEGGNIFRFSEPVLLRDNETRDAEALARMILRNRLTPGEYLNALTEAYLHFILQNSRPEDSITCAVRKIANELSERFFEFGLSPAALLNESGYAEDYIRAHFKKVFGKTPTEFLNALRIDHAVYLIELYKKAITLSEVSGRCGFADYVYFSKKFKEQMGVSPKVYTKQCEAKE